MRFTPSIRSRLQWLAISAGAGLLLAGAGCNNASRSDNGGANTPPTMSLNGAVATQTDAVQSTTQTTDDSVVPMPSDETDPETKSLIKELETNFQAWKARQPFDFQPAAKRVVQRLEAKFDVNQFRFASDAADVCEITGAYDSAKQIYSAIQKAAGQTDNEQLASIAKETAKTEIQKLDLVGTKPQIAGAVFGGGNLNWDDYKGKVVLLDFWATWCGPCREELPNVEKTYEQYHQQGFEVVGISLDDNKQKLADFLDKEKLPWVILFDENPAKQGWEGAAMTKDFFVSAIPATFLIGRDGKIVSIYARGELLEQQVKTLLAQKP